MISISREALTLFGFPIRWYGILIALGAFAGVMLADVREKRYGLAKDTVISLALWAIPAAIVGARLYYVLFRLDYYLSAPLSVFNIREGGMAIYGGLIAGVATGFLFARRKKISFLTLADLAAPSLALGQAVGRWGNFLNMEAYGIRITNPHLCFFPLSVYIPNEDAYFAATFFYESAWCFLIVILCLVAERRRLYRFRGSQILFYTVMYAFERTLVEGLRTDSLYLGSVRISQALSLLLLGACAVFLTLRIFAKKKRLFLLLSAGTAFLAGILSVSGVFPEIVLLPSAAYLLAVCLCALFSSAEKAPAAAKIHEAQ